MKKKPTSIRIQIPEPCSQSFEKMHPLPGGRYCDQCEKTVVDFTNLSDGEIVRIYQKRQGRVCGVFRNDQLNRSMPLPMAFEKRNNWKAIAAFASALLFGNMAAGQSEAANSKMTKEELIEQGNVPIQQKTQTISGLVTDEKGEPIMFATVYLNGTTQGTETNETGFFSIEVPIDLVDQELTFSFMGFESQTLLWTKEEFQHKPLYVFLKSGLTLPEVVVTYDRSLSVGGKVTGCGYRYNQDNLEEVKIETPIETPIEKEVIHSIFPNPFVSYINVKIELEKSEAILFHLYNEAGQLLFAETRELIAGTQFVPLDVNRGNLPEGIYFLRISDSIGEIRTKRVVKMKP